MMTATPFAFDELDEPSSDQILAGGLIHGEQHDGNSIKYCAHLRDLASNEPLSKKDAEPEVLFSAEDLAAAIDEARRITASEVETELRAAMAEDLDSRRCDILAAIRDQVELQKSAFEEEIARSANISLQLALALAQAVIPRALQRYPLNDISEALRRTLTQLTAEPSVELRMSPDLVECAKGVLSDLAEDTGFPGEAHVIADPTFSEGDIELRWKGGVMDRRLHHLKDQVSHIVNLWLGDDSQPSPDEAAEATAAPSGTGIEIDRSPPSHALHQQMGEEHHEH